MTAASPASAATTATVQQVPGAEIACPSTTTCVVVGGNQVVAITNGVPGPVQLVEGLTVNDTLYEVACTSATDCVVLGFSDLGDVVPIVNGIPGDAVFVPVERCTALIAPAPPPVMP